MRDYPILKNGKGIDWESELRRVWLDPPLTTEERIEIERAKEAFRRRPDREEDPDQLELFQEEK